MQSRFLEALLKFLTDSSDEALDLDTLAQKTGYSKYHLCRAFHAATQEPLQTYLRRLRLARGAEAIQKGARILDVALDCGYQSQEAFHRAFSRMFGITPKALQKGHQHPSLLLKQPWQETFMPPPPLTCRDEMLPEFTLHGIGGIYSYHQICDIEALWQRFHQRYSQQGNSWGVTLSCDGDNSSFRYYASIKANSVNDLSGLEAIHIPAQHYKVFRHQGQASTMLQAFNYIWGIWLPEQSKLTVKGVDFEYYPAGYDPNQESSWVDIYIPVVAK
ncbi:AraC family transcriptional regulator [Hahella ganghwensis]|uniref:AraC family transcriptional regulator n=1 Tax=Hahella ganghwensis TaxID=286420 RepID=UPI0003638C65|nr:AraC family transcriptional regulator [Hahella ganghwensis]